MKKWLEEITAAFINEYEKNTVTKWGKPLVGFADAKAVAAYAENITDNHGRPEDAVENASIVIAYFVPFLKEMADTNRNAGTASEEWAIAYEETNVLLAEINEYLISRLKDRGYKAAVHPAAGSFDREKLISSWSHRHIAYLAGLGTFGINNMLITEKGCCGRYSTIVTDLTVEPDSPCIDEFCGYKKDGSCGACIRKCPSGALTAEGFDRHKCYKVCMENAARYTEFGSSYAEEGEAAVGSEVCGKCVAGMPCAFL